MLLALIVAPIVICFVIRVLSRFTYKLIQDDIDLNDQVKGDTNRRRVRRQRRRKRKAIKATARTLKGVVKIQYYVIKAIIYLLRLVASLIASVGLLNIAVLLILVVTVLVGVTLITTEDTNDFSLRSSNNRASHINIQDINSYTNAGTLKTLSRIDMGRLDFTLGYSDKKPDLATKVLRSDFTDLAYLLTTLDNSFINHRGKSTSKHIGYMFGGYHYLNYETSIGSYVDLMKSKPNLKALKGISTEITTGYKAGVMFSEHKTIFMDCSGFVAWYYATIFTSLDYDNENLDTLANWFNGSVSSSNYKTGFNCTEVTYYNLKPGDILVKSYKDGETLKGHVAVVISDTDYIHASSESAGVFISKIADGNFATSKGFKKEQNATAYRPKIKFADD